MKPDRRYLHKFPERREKAHKGSFGRVLVLAGSVGMTGAAYLSSKGAALSGAGLVTCGVPESLVDVMASKLTCVMTRPFSETSARTFSAKAAGEVLESAGPFDAVALGPGLSTHPETVEFTHEVVTNLEKPLVVDADGLNCLAQDVTCLERRKGPTVLTPHPGELRRILGKDNLAQAQEELVRFTESKNSVLVFKTHKTTVTCGRDLFINTTGNPGMATGGSGDVLTGIIAGFLARGIEPFKAAATGVYIHGLAGDIAAAARTQEAMIASDILAFMPAAWKKYLEESP